MNIFANKECAKNAPAQKGEFVMTENEEKRLQKLREKIVQMQDKRE